MKIWLVTTGSSDVQLKTNEYWDDWYRLIKQACHRLPFEPIQAVRDAEEPYRIAPRALGMAYQAYPDEVWDALVFQLLKEFTAKLKDEPIAQIILLLTDQSQIFDETHRNDLKCPYWQDTCELQPVFERYFKTHFPNAELVPLVIAPQEGESGLDDWNFALELVRSKLREGISGEPTTVYVSHQAGTPAVSSAVQFSSLARFRNDVQFLVSNEYQSEQTRTIPRSTYLRGIQIQEAIALLERCDYGGVREILGLTSASPSTEAEKRIKYLLEAGIQWNFAEFQKFKKIIVDRNLLPEVKFPWWRSGYESAYLAVVRLTKQGNTVEAMFHSYRAIEGSIGKWAETKYKSHIEQDAQYGPQIKLSIQNELPNYPSALSESMQNNFQKWGRIGLYGVQLYELLKQARPSWQTDPHIKVVWETTKNQRNELFHRIEGLQEAEVFQAWNTQTLETWKAQILGCLNFLAEKDLPEKFQSLEEASLMAKVHQELEKAIAQL